MNVQIPVKWLQELLALCGPEDHELRERVMVSITAMDEQAARAVAVPDGWREKFAADVYADLAAADNQDVPLEEYPARILKVLDSIVGPRHPVVIKWRNDAIRNCIAIAYKYCRDPESHKYLKQDLEAMLTTEPTPQAQADASPLANLRHLYQQLANGGVKDSAQAKRIAEGLLSTAIARLESQAQADARDAGQEKPPAGRYVLAWMDGKEIPIRAMWVPKSWLAAGDECPEGWAEYDEDKDEYFCPEGWYEANEHEETHWHVGKPIIAWAELPRYAAIAAAKGE